MAVYSYSAQDATQRLLTGTLIAETPQAARQRLRSQGLAIQSFAVAKTKSRRLRFGVGSSVRRREQVAESARYLALLLRADVPLAEALDVVIRQTSGKLATALKTVHDRVTGGVSLADALEDHGGWFDQLFVSAVRVGEVSGNLDEALTELADHLHAHQKLRSQLTGALMYPLILVCVSTLVVVFLMTFVIPQILTVLVASGRPLPASTALLKGMSDFLIGHWFIVAVSVVSTITMIGAILRSPTGGLLWHRHQLRLPLLGSLIQKSIVAGFAQRMAVLLKTGIPYVEALRTVAKLERHRVLRSELELMASAIESGGDLAHHLEDSAVFPPVVSHLVTVGADSGELTAMLGQLRQRYEQEVALATTKFTTALEPLLIVLLAAGVGFVVFACMMPILEATKGIA